MIEGRKAFQPCVLRFLIAFKLNALIAGSFVLVQLPTRLRVVHFLWFRFQVCAWYKHFEVKSCPGIKHFEITERGMRCPCLAMSPNHSMTRHAMSWYVISWHVWHDLPCYCVSYPGVPCHDPSWNKGMCVIRYAHPTPEEEISLHGMLGILTIHGIQWFQWTHGANGMKFHKNSKT